MRHGWQTAASFSAERVLRGTPVRGACFKGSAFPPKLARGVETRTAQGAARGSPCRRIYIPCGIAAPRVAARGPRGGAPTPAKGPAFSTGLSEIAGGALPRGSYRH